MKKYFAISVLLGFGLTGTAFAQGCSLTADARTVEAQLEHSPVAFVGRVMEVHENSVVFAVEHWVKPLQKLEWENRFYEQKLEPKNQKKFPCETEVKVGERWFWAGTKPYQPSVYIFSNGLRSDESIFFFLKSRTFNHPFTKP